MRICTECTNLAWSKGKCRKHLGLPTDAKMIERMVNGMCEDPEGCDRKAERRGLCRKHYARMMYGHKPQKRKKEVSNDK